MLSSPFSPAVYGGLRFSARRVAAQEYSLRFQPQVTKKMISRNPSPEGMQASAYRRRNSDHANLIRKQNMPFLGAFSIRENPCFHCGPTFCRFANFIAITSAPPIRDYFPKSGPLFLGFCNIAKGQPALEPEATRLDRHD